MNCRACGYALWNLPARTCPECGTPFLPSEYEFVPNSVRFMCPGCGQDYYGTDAKGHLVPVRFVCVRCTAPLHMDQMILLPTAGVQEQETVPYRLPWADRAALGFVRGWLRTIAMAVLSPTRLMRAARDTRPASAAWFAFVTWTAAALGGFSPVVIWFFWRPMNVRPAGLFSFGMPVIVWAVVWSSLIGVWGLLAHGILRATGPTAGGIGRSYVAILFSSAIMIIGAVPCLGAYLMILVIPLWWAILAAMMLREAHRVSGWRAAAAGVAPPVLGLAAVIGLWIALVTVSVSRAAAATVAAQNAQAAAAGAGRASSPAATRTGRIVRALQIQDGSDGAGPSAHVARLLLNDAIQPHDLTVSFLTGTSAWDVAIGPMTLAAFEDAPAAERLRAVEATEQAQPPGVIAHRLGDFVFTYHGIDLRTPDPRLWLVVFSPDPRSAPPRPGLPIVLVIGLADGSTAECAPEALAGALAAQNAVRAEHGLAPLPDPASVTQDAPATR